MEKRTVLVPITIDKDWVDSVTSSIREGVGYWALDFYTEDKKGAEYTSEVLSLGGEIIIVTDDNYGGNCTEINGYGDGCYAYTLTLDMLLEGFKKYVEWAIGLDRGFYIDASDIDTTEADCIVQLALFGEVIFG